jgi:phage recombination protein Bet
MVTREKEAEKAIIQVGAEERKVTITFNDVKKYLCPKASDAEIGLFLKTCQAEGLNPFAREVYLVKYADDQPAAIIIATEAFVKAAETCPEYDGAEAGIILKDTAGKLEFREGSFLLDEEEKNLVGGWAKVYRKDRQRPVYAAINIKECMKYTRSGKPTRFWEEMPATMVRKVALSRALREAFPNRFGGTLTTAEFEEIPEGQLPPAYTKPNGEQNWSKFWAKVKSELGLTTGQARELLQVDSIKEELIDAGWTMERIWDELTLALQQRKAAQVKAEAENQSAGVDATRTPGGPPTATGASAPAEEVDAPSPLPQRVRDPSTVRTLNDLYKACNEDWGLQPKDVIRDLGYKSQMDIVETPTECYLKIRAMREG